MFKDMSSVLLIVLVLVVGGLAYLLLPGRLNGPASTQTGTSTIATGTVITYPGLSPVSNGSSSTPQ
ncbi:MAG: hypothetical protein WC640_01830 [Candidatus Paceibacterota bacterium]